MAEDQQLYFNGDIYTVDDAMPSAEAVAVRAGKIIAVGSEAECKRALTGGYESIDLKGRTLMPGFIDTHLHPTGMITYELYGDLSRVTTIEELQEKLRQVAKEIPPPEWVGGLQFEDQKLKSPRLPTRHDLDQAVPGRPAIVVKADGHMVIANTKAIEAASASAKTPDPEGGKIDREPDGFPAGPFREAAVAIPLGAMPMPDMQRIRGVAQNCFQRLASHGITSAGVILQTDDEGVFGKQGAFDILLMNVLLDLIPINLYISLVAHELAPIEAAKKTKLHNPEPGAGHRINGLKFWADGTFGSCTAFMHEPFTDQPDKRGFLILSPEEMYRRMVMAHNAGLQIMVHVIGDAACRTIIDLFERLLKEHPRKDHRHRIEHASILDEKAIKDMARLCLVVCTQPLFIHNEKDWLHKRLGNERAKWVYPFRAFLEHGVKLAGASDAPICSTDVLHSLQCLVTREGFETHQCITAEQAIRMFTIDAAFAQFEEKFKGSITPGKRADFVILSGNPLRVPPENIRDIRVEKTICK